MRGNDPDIRAEAALLVPIPTLVRVHSPYEQVDPFLVNTPFRNEDDVVHDGGGSREVYNRRELPCRWWDDGGLTNAQKARIIRAYKPRLDALRRGMDVKVQLGAVWHFSLAVGDPEKSAQFWIENFDLQEMFRSDEAIALTNDAMIIGFFKGTPHPDTIDHMSFYLESMRALREALDMLKKNGVELEDPGNEIGPTSPGSPHMGLWFHDPDGYRWELSVQNGARER